MALLAVVRKTGAKTKQKNSVHTIIAVSHKVDVERLVIILCFELKFKCSNVITIIL